ncbi:DUF4153 domain-containing protein [Marinobacter sp. V034]|uniref:DUF4153 domain-containing protein n=1 Tax=Marinobacter sp. V034 TaxID=3459610 RepID=UPI00404508A1
MNDSANPRLDNATRYGIVGIALLQGMVLYGLYWTIDHDIWPATDPSWLTSLYTVAIALPLFFYLGMERLRDYRNLIVLLPLTGLLFWMGWHLSWVLYGVGDQSVTSGPHFMVFIPGLGVGLFILALFFRVWCIGGRERFGYETLLEHSWQHALMLAMAGLFLLVFWLLLFLWGALFNVIGISYFQDLFEEALFIYPATALVGGWGLVLIRERIRVMTTMRTLCEALISALLPLVALIVVLFLGALPFTGLEKIWQTGKAGFLMMSLAVVFLFFFNAVLSNNARFSDKSRGVRGLVMAALVILPVYTALAAWALCLRVDQYGLTYDRLWAGVIQLLMASFILTYSVLIVLRQARAVTAIREANKWLAIVVAVVLILVNTPVWDLRSWSASNQVERLINGEVTPADFDYDYLRFSLGSYGVQALKELQTSDFVKEHPQVSDRISASLKQKNRWHKEPMVDKNDRAAVVDMLRRIPGDLALPAALVDRVSESMPACLNVPGNCWIGQARSQEGVSYWLVFTQHYAHYVSGNAFVQHSNVWQMAGDLATPGCLGDRKITLTDSMVFEPVPGPFVAFRSGGCFYRVDANAEYLGLQAPLRAN